MNAKRVIPAILLVAATALVAVQSTAPASSSDPKGTLVIQGLGDKSPTITIREYEWGAKQVFGDGGTGGSTGRADLDEFKIEKLLDQNSVALAEALLNGEHFAEATVTIFKPGTTTPASIFTLGDILISEIHHLPAGVNTLESVSMNYNQIDWVFKAKSGDKVICWKPDAGSC